MFARFSALRILAARLLAAGLLAAGLLEIGLPTLAFAQATPATPERIETIKLSITPAAESTPLLKYRLNPRFVDLRQGNAAQLYAQAALHYKPTAADEKRIGELLKAPRAEFERFVAEKNAADLMRESPLDLLRIASRRERCDWELPLREQNVFSVLLPEQQELRKLGRLVALRARAFAVKKDYAQAIDMLSIGYRMAQHEGNTPLLISGLVGISIARMMDEVVFELATLPGSPNLYWALTTRPTPLVAWAGALEAESSALDLALPMLNAAVEKDPQAMNWEAGMKEITDMLNMAKAMGEGNQESGFMTELGRAATLTGIVLLKAKEMREYLIARGVPRERVERMGNTQLLLAHDKLRFDEHRDRIFSWMALPFPQARAGMEDAERLLKQATKANETTLPWAGLLLPAVASVRWTHAKQERVGDVLRVVEALRLYAAEHEGKLPSSLDELQSRTPLPLDCVTGKPLDYIASGGTAKLTLPPNFVGRETMVYEITVAK